MTVFWTAASGCALAVWCVVAFARAGAFRTRERLRPAPGFDAARTDLSNVTVLVPARDEVAAVGRTLAALGRQGHGLEVVLVDDRSRDGTADAALAAAFAAARPGAVPRLQLRLLRGRLLEPGWGGKLWALEQGLELVTRHYTLLLDADIELADGMVAALREKARLERLDLVSIMARLNCTGWWERLLVPPFVFFFKLIYPFAWVNDPRRRTAAAAGGCIFVRTDVLRRVGAFGALRDALIDDCTLAARVKQAEHTHLARHE